MTVDELVSRSISSFESDPDTLSCADILDPLVTVVETDKLLPMPIWEMEYTLGEGSLYRAYIEKNPLYQSIYLRREVNVRLQKAANSLPSHLKLVIRAGHRPLEVQKQEITTLINTGLEEYKMNSYEALLFARTYVDDPSIKIPSHCSGSAVDVELFNTLTNTVEDFGTLMNTESEVSHLHSDEITKTQKSNRMILLRAMLSAGFAPTVVEWWHFSYGDTVWAYFYDKEASLYDLIEPTFATGS